MSARRSDKTDLITPPGRFVQLGLHCACPLGGQQEIRVSSHRSSLAVPVAAPEQRQSQDANGKCLSHRAHLLVATNQIVKKQDRSQKTGAAHLLHRHIFSDLR